MTATVLIPNVIAMTLLLVLMFSSGRVSRQAVLWDTRIFSLMAGCNFLQCAGEIFVYSIDGVMLPGFHELILVSNCALYVVNICFAYLWVIYADYKIFESKELILQRAKWLALPAVVIVVCALVNLVTPVFFSVSDANEYHRTSWFFIPYLVTYFYLVYGSVFIYRHKSQARKYVFLPVWTFMLPVILGSVVQYFCYGVSTVWVGCAMGLMAVYINLQNETSYIDALSGVYTRSYLYQYLAAALRKDDAGTRVAGIMVDIDKFKSINDKFGHLTGDDAIRSVGKILLKELPSSCIATRYGGDEFVVVQQLGPTEDIAATVDLIERAVDRFNREKGKPYTLSFSMGTSELDVASDTADAFLSRLDQAMYESKRAGTRVDLEPC